MFILSRLRHLLFGIIYLLYVRNPIVNLRVFKDRNFALGSLQIAIMGFVLYASAVLIPQFAQQQLGLQRNSGLDWCLRQGAIAADDADPRRRTVL